jgi:surface antigen
VIIMTTKLQTATLAACAAVLGLAGASALARSPDAQSRYESERAVCMHGLSNQDRATCLKEAGAALQEARRGQLATADERALEHNRLARCDAQTGADRDDCVMRMQGAGTTSGSAQAGGILRELSRPDTTR